MAVPDLQAAISQLQQKNVDAAITMLEDKIDELPAHLTAHVLLARAYEAQQRWDEALQCWENVRFLMPNSPVARDGKARILRRLGQGDAEAPAAADETAPDDTAPDDTAPDDTTVSPKTPRTAEDAAEADDVEADDDVDAPAPSDEPDDQDEEKRTVAPSEATAAEEDDAPDEPPSQPTASPEDDEADTPPSDDTDASPAPDDTSASPTTAAEAVSELEQLRRQAEEEARQGGARSSMASSASSTDADTPEERVGQMEDDEDLDRLIDELESARIEPSPEMEEVPEPDLDDNVEDIVSETLARIHEAQDQYRKAAQIYVKLASQEPDQARAYLKKASEMREQAEAQEAAETDGNERAE